MYGSYTCSACAATRKCFGESFEKITEIECNPHAPENEAERCLERNIKTTPTWILENDGVEGKRLDGYQLMEDLALEYDCPFN